MVLYATRSVEPSGIILILASSRLLQRMTFVKKLELVDIVLITLAPLLLLGVPGLLVVQAGLGFDHPDL